MRQGKKMLVALATLFSKWPTYHEAIKTGIWTPSGKPHKREAKLKRKHEWKWSKERKHYRCGKCHSTAYCTTKLLECTPVPEPPEGESPYIPDRMHLSHAIWGISRDDKDPIWFCRRCGHYAFRRCKKLTEVCRGPLAEKSVPWYRLQELKEGKYPNTKEFWAKPTLALRSFKGHAVDLVRPLADKVRCEPPRAVVRPPSMLRVDMEGSDMWADFADHMPNRPDEVEERDFAFDLDFFGSDQFCL